MKYQFVLILILLVGCTTTNTFFIPTKDKEKIELLLSKYKKHAFLDLYRKSIKQAEKKYKLQKCDSLFDVTEMGLYIDYSLPKYYFTKEKPNYSDYNYDKMIKKWLNKNYPPDRPLDNPNIKTIREFKRAFDFYESKDLQQYIDSLQQSFYKRYKVNDLDLEYIEELN